MINTATFHKQIGIVHFDFDGEFMNIFTFACHFCSDFAHSYSFLCPVCISHLVSLASEINKSLAVDCTVTDWSVVTLFSLHTNTGLMESSISCYESPQVRGQALAHLTAFMCVVNSIMHLRYEALAVGLPDPISPCLFEICSELRILDFAKQ